METLTVAGWTTLHGTVVRIDELASSVEFQPFAGDVLYCAAARDTLLRLRARTGQQVAAQGRATWDFETLAVVQFEIEDFQPFNPGSQVEAMEELRRQFGHYFDHIDDVDAWVIAVRRGEN